MNDKDYKISAVGKNVKEWAGAYGPMKTYILKLEETGEEVIEINKKPESPAPAVGDVLFGHIEDSKSKEFPTRKFKSVSKNFGGGGSAKTGYQESPEKQASIYHSVALNNAAVVFQGSGEKASVILDLADAFDEWLKGSPETAPTQATEQKETVIEDFDDQEEVDLSDVPF